MSKLDDLKARYRRERDKLTERAKAELERDIWEETGRDGSRPQKASLVVYLREKFGKGRYCERARLLNGGDAVDPVWEAIEKKRWPLRGMCDLVVQAREDAVREGRELADVLQDAMAAYEALPVRVSPNGTVYHVKEIKDTKVARPTPVQPPPPARKEKRSGEAAKTLRKETASPSTMDHQGAKPAWARLREAVTALVAPMLQGVAPAAREKLIVEFDRDLRALTDRYKGKIDRVKEQGNGTLAPCSLGEIQDACRTLAMPSEPSRLGDKLSLKQAKRAFQAVAVRMHPDQNKGPDAEEKFRALMAANAVIEDYLSAYGNADPTTSKSAR